MLTALLVAKSIPCTNCGCSQSSHGRTGFGRWHCCNCGRNCKLFFV